MNTMGMVYVMRRVKWRIKEIIAKMIKIWMSKPATWKTMNPKIHASNSTMKNTMNIAASLSRGESALQLRL